MSLVVHGPRAKRALDPDAPRAALLWDGVATKLMEAFTGGVVLTALVLHAGGSDLSVALLAALLLVAQLAQFLALRLDLVRRHRRAACLGAAAASRATLGCVGLVALAAPGTGTLALLAAGLAASALLSGVSAIAWASWMRDLLPRHLVGRVLARRLRGQAIAGAAGTLAGGLALSLVPAEAVGPLLAGTFAAGGIVGLLGLAFAARVPDAPPNPAETRPTLRGVLREAREHPDAWRVVRFAAECGLALGLALPFLAVHLLRELGLAYAAVAVLSACGLVVGVAAYVAWGRIADRAGSRVVLSGALPLVAAGLLVLALAPPSYPALLLAHALLGAGVSGVEVGTARLLLRHAPFMSAGAFLASAAVARALAGGAGVLAGGAVATLVGARQAQAGFAWDGAWWGFVLTRHELLFAAAALLALYAAHRVLGLAEPEGESHDVIHEVSVELHAFSSLRPVRALGDLAGHLARHAREEGRRSRRA